MVITDYLERNARLYGSDSALVEINPSEERDNAVGNLYKKYSLLGAPPLENRCPRQSAQKG